MITHLPAFGICGYSGSGKTTLILELIQRLSALGLRVGVIKHDVHGLNVDREGKDSDRFFKAGADVLMRSPNERFLRLHPHAEESLEATLRSLAPGYDLLLLEGHKDTPLVEKVWLQSDTGEPCPPEAVNIVRVLRRDEDRVGILMNLLLQWLKEKSLATPLYAGILIGGESRRMGTPKHLLQLPNGRTWLEKIVSNLPASTQQVVLLGGRASSRALIPPALNHLPLLPDITDKQGPLAGMLAAMRWSPFASWLFLSCDMPLLTAEALQWVVSHRAPGVWGVLPRTAISETQVARALRARACASPATETKTCPRAERTGHLCPPDDINLLSQKTVEPLPGWYDFRSRHLLEQCHGPSALAGREKIISPDIPAEHANAWTNINTPEELQSLTTTWLATKGT